MGLPEILNAAGRELLTSRQIRERAAHEAEKDTPPSPPRSHQTAADRRAFYRARAGWPKLKEKHV